MMFLLFIIISAIAFCHGVPLSPKASAQTHGGRIVGGKSTTIDQYPYQVILQTINNDLLCGGSIISSNVVLTAAHCVEDVMYMPGYYQIRAGTSYPTRGGSVHKIKKVIQHKNYGEQNINNGPAYDIAIIFVKTSFNTDSNHKSIPLYYETEEIESGKMTVISGFGDLNSNGNLASQLQVANVPYVDKRTCNKAYRRYGGIGAGEICAGYLGEGGKDTCQGDSGGPLVVDGKLAGVVSYGVGCAEPDYPGVYTEVSYYYDWIVENAGLEA